MQVKDLIASLGAWDGDAEVEFYVGPARKKASGPYGIVSIYSESVTFRDGRPQASADKLVTIDLERPGGR